jgi:hypothetical protein
MSLRVDCGGYSIPLAIVPSSSDSENFLFFGELAGKGEWEKTQRKE